MTQVEGSTQLGRISRSVRSTLENYFAQAREVVRTAMHWAVLPRQKVKVVRKDFANSGKMEKEIYEILEKVQEVHDTDRSYKEVGLTEYEWNRYNRGSENTHDMPSIGIEETSRTTTATTSSTIRKVACFRSGIWSTAWGFRLHPTPVPYYRMRASAGVVDGVKIRRSIRMTIAHAGKGAENGKPIGSFCVTGSLEEPSTHTVVWYPEFEDDFRPSTAKNARKIIWFGEDQRGRPLTISCISTTAPSNLMCRRKPFW